LDVRTNDLAQDHLLVKYRIHALQTMIPFLDLKAINDRDRGAMLAAMQDVLDSGWYIRGEKVSTFEKEFSSYCGTEQCVGVANGLDALILILEAYKIMGLMVEGDEVIVPSNTYIASILAISKAGLVPVLVEPHPYTYNLDAHKAEAAISEKTKAIMHVHLYGQMSLIKEMRELCDSKGLKLIEDAAQAHGAVFHGRKAGAWGDAAGFSFYPGKNLGALGDGGAVCGSDHELMKTVKSLANYGSDKKYLNLYKGFNSRLDELQAAILSVKLKRLDADNTLRRKIATAYNSMIQHPEVTLPLHPEEAGSHVWHIYPVLVKRREDFMRYLEEHGVQTLIHYPVPPHKQQAYAEWASRAFPISEHIHATEVSLPISPTMTDSDVKQVIEKVNAFR